MGGMRAVLLLALVLGACQSAPPRSPNVILIVTDDQGWGDFGFQGNPVILTPHLDALAGQSAQLTNFYVSPVCAPTRSSLMTGRSSQRTRAFDTYIGRAMMEPEEVTVAEVLQGAGWATGIFGKWHLGDCYPMRAIDQGFDEALVHRGGGIGQPSDPEGGERKYTDAVLFRNGEREQTEGYCTDVYFDEALDWMQDSVDADQPFFAYIATNAPHSPLHDLPGGKLHPAYADAELMPSAVRDVPGHALPEKYDKDTLARVFSMITNIDDNVGKLMARLDTMGVRDDTLVLFLVDNGPNTRRFVGGMRGMKSHVHEGGVKSPLLAHWPARLDADTRSDRVAAHMDLMPTILDACGVAKPTNLDGRSVLTLLEGDSADWPDRAITIQSHRGDTGLRYHNFFTRTQDWKLVNASGFGRELDSLEPDFELYDMRNDPLETQSVAAENPEVLRGLVEIYDAWFDDVSTTRPDNYAPPRIHIGASAAPRTVLTRQDWRRIDSAGWGWQGAWQVDVKARGPYDVRVRFPNKPEVATLVTLNVGSAVWTHEPAADERFCTFERVTFPAGEAALRVDIEGDEKVQGALQVFVKKSL